ncbi:MAG: alpha/beta hydrolase [Candidatus Eremiobacteraeota bacterium]|nr:alpha/beta hydrolase [Candidatus Eremiobacteraeota bacterium]
MKPTFRGAELVQQVVERQSRAAIIPSGLLLDPATPGTDITSDNMMVLDTNGRFDKTSRKNLADAFIAYRDRADQPRLALFFHGGLVSTKTGIAGASQLLQKYAVPEAGNAYPFFTVWETGIEQVLHDHWETVLRSALFQSLFGHISGAVGDPDAAPADLVVAPARSPLTAADKVALRSAVDSDPVVIRAVEAVLGSVVLDDVSAPAALLPMTPASIDIAYLDPDVKRKIVGASAHAFTAASVEFNFFSFGVGAVEAAVRIIERYSTGRWHPGACTITEEIARQFYVGPLGNAVWSEMKDQVAAGFATPERGGSALVQELAKLIQERQGGVRLTIAAHSAGSIYASVLLEKLDEALASVSFEWGADFVFFAATIRMDRFAETLNRVQRRTSGFRAFQLGEQFESTDSILKLGKDTAVIPPLTALYPGSLPYAIAGVLEDDDGDTPLLGMERYWRDTYDDPIFSDSVAPVRAFVDAIEGGRVTSSQPASGMPGRRSTAATHGGMPLDPETVISTQHILANGFS